MCGVRDLKVCKKAEVGEPISVLFLKLYYRDVVLRILSFGQSFRARFGFDEILLCLEVLSFLPPS